MIRIYVTNKTRRFLCWIFGVSLMFCVYTKKTIVVEMPFDRQETLKEASFSIVNQKLVEVAESESLPAITPFKCLSTAKLYKGIRSTICVKNPKVDKFVSGGIIQRGCWEKHIVMETMRGVDQYPSAVFLDIGANIGMYTVMIAQMKRRVVAVDPIRENLALISSSVSAAGNSPYVQYVASPISDVVESLVPRTDNTDNQGGTRLVTGGPTGDQTARVNTTTLRNLVLFANTTNIIVKLDVEGFECKVLGPYLAQPVDGVFLPYIFLEWMHIKHNLDNNCPDLDGLITQLSRAGYEPFDLVSKKKLLQPTKSRMMKYIDLLWVHKSAIQLF